MSFPEFIRAQLRNLPIVPDRETCTGGTYIVTGSNTGIGFETAKHLVALGASRVIIAVRSVEKGEAAKARIEATTGITGVAEVWHLDMASIGSIKAFSARAASELGVIDALVANSTAALDTWTVSEGMETSVMVNVVGTLLLVLLLLPKMRESAGATKTAPHVVVVTSGLGFSEREVLKLVEDDVFEALNEEGKSHIHKRYAVTKLLQIFAVRQLATQLPASQSGVVINLVSPGLCNTGLTRYGRTSFRLYFYLFNLALGRTPEMGSRAMLHALSAGVDSHGRYLSDCEIKEFEHPVPETSSENHC
ncbi:short chain dehydrogenase [Colletotrichum graminicola M1.001]|uniref:Short chain dehydrogenase n=1 Tax=Colletotrichum graminicola (strain M1.001 / M2 / FGSC 10212) TaxID=645133 RepID=E3QTP0_COLGM|nr:short chain dehydrogenase [Colletotrichum graminicola M1.001]EFQ34202.1 short chain dehydrogenase [Colletotrichum graminicola M1.001]